MMRTNRFRETRTRILNRTFFANVFIYIFFLFLLDDTDSKGKKIPICKFHLKKSKVSLTNFPFKYPPQKKRELGI